MRATPGETAAPSTTRTARALVMTVSWHWLSRSIVVGNTHSNTRRAPTPADNRSHTCTTAKCMQFLQCSPILSLAPRPLYVRQEAALSGVYEAAVCPEKVGVITVHAQLREQRPVRVLHVL